MTVSEAAQVSGHTDASSGKSTRLHYLDWLQVLGVLGVFLFHSIHPFESLTEWHIKNAERSGLASLFAMWMLLQERLWEALLDRLPFLKTWQGGRWEARIRRLYMSLRAYDVRSIVRALAVSLVFNVTLVLANYFVGLAFGVRISMLYFWVFVPITSVVTMIPISLNGLGVREMGYVALFTQAGVPEQVAFSMSLSFYSFTVISGLIGGVLYIMRGTRGYLTREVRS